MEFLPHEFPITDPLAIFVNSLSEIGISATGNVRLDPFRSTFPHGPIAVTEGLLCTLHKSLLFSFVFHGANNGGWIKRLH